MTGLFEKGGKCLVVFFLLLKQPLFIVGGCVDSMGNNRYLRERGLGGLSRFMAAYLCHCEYLISRHDLKLFLLRRRLGVTGNEVRVFESGEGEWNFRHVWCRLRSLLGCVISLETAMFRG